MLETTDMQSIFERKEWSGWPAPVGEMDSHHLLGRLIKPDLVGWSVLEQIDIKGDSVEINDLPKP